MSSWKSESFHDIINQGHFRITDPGPLHAPINTFAVRRDEHLRLILETHCPDDAKSPAIEYPSGMIRINTDAIELTNIAGTKARMVGVQPVNARTSSNYETGAHGLKETSRIDYIEATVRDDLGPRYTIEWLDNVGGHFVWPDSYKDETGTTEARTVSGEEGRLILIGAGDKNSFTRSCVRFVVAGIELYLCASWAPPSEIWKRPGCIIYVGTPDDDIRRKIRTALSYTLGMYLVYLGCTVFSDDWHTVYFKSISAYSIGRRVFDLVVLPPAPLGPKYQHEITSQAIGRMVNSIYSQYDDLQFGTLSWIYWHALCATTQTSPADFGSAIEALQRNYVKTHPDSFKTKLVPDTEMWRTLSSEVRQAISKLNVPEGDRKILLQKAGSLNDMPRSETMKLLLESIHIELGVDETRAWRERNRAAHGAQIEDDKHQHQAIRDTKLLRGIFDRMLLRITNGSDFYHDYASLEFPIRNLVDPVPTVTS